MSRQARIGWSRIQSGCRCWGGSAGSRCRCARVTASISLRMALAAITRTAATSPGTKSSGSGLPGRHRRLLCWMTTSRRSDWVAAMTALVLRPANRPVRWLSRKACSKSWSWTGIPSGVFRLNSTIAHAPAVLVATSVSVAVRAGKAGRADSDLTGKLRPVPAGTGPWDPGCWRGPTRGRCRASPPVLGGRSTARRRGPGPAPRRVGRGGCRRGGQRGWGGRAARVAPGRVRGLGTWTAVAAGGARSAAARAGGWCRGRGRAGSSVPRTASRRGGRRGRGGCGRGGRAAVGTREAALEVDDVDPDRGAAPLTRPERVAPGELAPLARLGRVRQVKGPRGRSPAAPGDGGGDGVHDRGEGGGASPAAEHAAEAVQRSWRLQGRVRVGGDDPDEVVVQPAVLVGQQHHAGEVAAACDHPADQIERGLGGGAAAFRPGVGGRVQFEVGAEQHQHPRERQPQALQQGRGGRAAGEHGAAGGGRDEVRHRGGQFDQHRLGGAPGALDLLAARWPGTLDLGQQQLLQRRRAAEDLADRGDVAGHELRRVGLADDPPTAGLLQRLVAAQGLQRATQRLRRAAVEATRPVQLVGGGLVGVVAGGKAEGARGVEGDQVAATGSCARERAAYWRSMSRSPTGGGWGWLRARPRGVTGRAVRVSRSRAMRIMAGSAPGGAQTTPAAGRGVGWSVAETNRPGRTAGPSAASGGTGPVSAAARALVAARSRVRARTAPPSRSYRRNRSSARRVAQRA